MSVEDVITVWECYQYSVNVGRAWLWRYEPQVYVFIVKSFFDEGLLFKGISPKIYYRRKIWTTSMIWTSSTRSSLAKSQKTTKPSVVKWCADSVVNRW